MENEIKNSEDYINKKTGKNSGFSVPSNYFDNLEDAISLKIYEENLSINPGFTAPKDYFNTLEDSVLTKIKTPKKERRVVSFKERILKTIPYAAAACIVLFIGLNSFSFNTNEEVTFDSLNDSDYEYWLDSNTLNSSDVSNLLSSDILEENDFSLTNIDDEIIEDYMYNIDNSSLINEID
jgi:hypothetical protein